MTDTNEKIRALFLSALMVMSVFGMTVAFAGTAAANHGDAETHITIGEDENPRVWQGQDILFNFTGDNESATFDVTGPDGNDLGEFDTDEQGHAVVSSSEFGSGEHTVTREGIEVTRFRISVQDLSAEFSPDSVTSGDSSTVTLDSNRAGPFNVSVSAEGLSGDDLEAIFDADGGTVVEEVGDDEITISGVEGGLGTQTDIDADLSDLGVDDYTFDFDVTDTTAAASADVSVTEDPEADASFVNDPYQGAVGDNVVIELETNEEEVTVEISGSGDEYTSTLVIDEIDPDENVEITFNTFAAGQGDVSESFSVGDNGNLNTSASSATDETTFGGDFRLAPDDYDLSVTPAGSEDESDFAGLTLVERSTGDATTYIAPDGTTNIGSDDLDAWTEREQVAENDTVAVQIDVTGVFAYIDENVSVNGTDFTVELQNPGRYSTGSSFNASDEGVTLVQEEENGVIYLVIDMDEADQDFQAGQQWEATFSINGDENPYVAAGETETASSSFAVIERELTLDVVEPPYQMTPTEDSVAAGESTVAPGTDIDVRFRKGGSDGFVVTVNDQIDEEGNWSVTHDFSDREEGEEFTIRVRVPGDTANNPHVDNANGVFSDTAESDTVADVEALNERIEELEAENEQLQEDLDMAESERDQLQDDLAEVEQERDDLQDQVDELENQDPETVEVTRTVTVEVTPEDADTDGQPGFGIAIAVVALLAAALLAVRRSA